MKEEFIPYSAFSPSRVTPDKLSKFKTQESKDKIHLPEMAPTSETKNKSSAEQYNRQQKNH